MEGIPAPGTADLEMETAPVGRTGPEETVLASQMDPDYTPFPDTAFPVYTLAGDRSHLLGLESACPGLCSVSSAAGPHLGVAASRTGR